MLETEGFVFFVEEVREKRRDMTQWRYFTHDGLKEGMFDVQFRSFFLNATRSIVFS